jgi:hypothetical protein
MFLSCATSLLYAAMLTTLPEGSIMHMLLPATVVSAWLSGSHCGALSPRPITCMMLRTTRLVVMTWRVSHPKNQRQSLMLRATRVAMTFRSDSIVHVGTMFRSEFRSDSIVHVGTMFRSDWRP